VSSPKGRTRGRGRAHVREKGLAKVKGGGDVSHQEGAHHMKEGGTWGHQQ
jgi:hypothetical protein